MKPTHASDPESNAPIPRDDEDELPGGQGWLLGFDPVDVEPDRDAWVTPKWIADAVGEWDLDPATNERSHIRAAKTFSLEEGQDGIALARYVKRSTRVWCNPPYSRGQVIKFVRAYRHTNFCFLLRFDHSTEWFAELMPSVELVLVPRNRRVQFDVPPGAKASSTPFPHALYYRRAEDATPEIRALCYCLRSEQPLEPR